MLNVGDEGMNCILGDGGSCADMSYHAGLIVIYRNGSWQDATGLDQTIVSAVCILILF